MCGRAASHCQAVMWLSKMATLDGVSIWRCDSLCGRTVGTFFWPTVRVLSLNLWSLVSRPRPRAVAWAHEIATEQRQGQVRRQLLPMDGIDALQPSARHGATDLDVDVFPALLGPSEIDA